MAAIDFREKLLAGLGGDWPKPGQLNVRLREKTQQPSFTIHSYYYDAEPGDKVPALLLVPEGVSAQKPAPAILCLHQHQYHFGKNEPAGLAGAAMHHTAAALAREGYVTLCIDMLGFGERRGSKLKDYGYERFLFLRYLVQGKCLAWKNILDIRRAVDFLMTRHEVRHDAIGCYGHSMGSTNSWLAGPWEDRLRCFVCNCCLPTYAAIHREEMLHCFPNYIPGINQHGDMQDIVALMAPRPVHMNFGELDGGSPIDLVRVGLKEISNTYASMHAEKHFSYFIEKGMGHAFTPRMWQRTKQWFDKYLKT